MSVRSLNQNWQFREVSSSSDFLSVSQFPTNIHLDLLHHRLIPDPFVGKNAEQVQWVGERDWEYRTTFESGKATTLAILCFYGLDTFARVYLNGYLILDANNMFATHSVDVAKLLHKDDKPNELLIRFASAWRKGLELKASNPEHKWLCWNGDPSRLAVRKAQYHYGWDWGPRLMTCGPWRPIDLVTGESIIEDVQIHSSVDASLEKATVTAKVKVSGSADRVVLRLSSHWRASVVSECEIAIRNGEASKKWLVSGPVLWYPRGHGHQARYDIEVVASSGDKEHARVTKQFGLRRVELVEENIVDEPGRSFYFKVNNIPIFCGGSNWIPADSFLPQLTRQRYEDIVRLVAIGSQNMLRVWGGGIYEDDAFYDTCDHYGIMVWQDFMFACGNYPANDVFLQNVEAEVVSNVKRLHLHPCILLWAGNNEDYQIMETEKLEYDQNEQDASKWLRTTFPARYIYEKLIPETLERHLPNAIYRYGSPFGGKTTRDQTVGDLHQWNVWHEKQEPYQNFDKLAGRFVSEFGMQAFPDMHTVDSFLYTGAKPRRYCNIVKSFQSLGSKEAYSQSSTMDYHNKAADHTRRLAIYMEENFRVVHEPLEYYIYCTQLMQSECVASAFRQWRRKWRGEGRRECGGALVWQLNDCWPCISWSLIDSNLRPKLAYYAVKREMESLTISIKRVEIPQAPDCGSSNGLGKGYRVQVWACTSWPQESRDRLFLDIDSWDASTGQLVQDLCWNKQVSLLANQSTELGEYEIAAPSDPETVPDTRQLVVRARLSTEENRASNCPQAEHVNWPDPLRYVYLPKLEFKLESRRSRQVLWNAYLAENDEEKARVNKPYEIITRKIVIKVRAEIGSPDRSSSYLIQCIGVCVKGLRLEHENPKVYFDNNGLDLVPGAVALVRAANGGINEGNLSKVSFTCLGQY